MTSSRSRPLLNYKIDDNVASLAMNTLSDRHTNTHYCITAVAVMICTEDTRQVYWRPRNRDVTH